MVLAQVPKRRRPLGHARMMLERLLATFPRGSSQAHTPAILALRMNSGKVARSNRPFDMPRCLRRN